MRQDHVAFGDAAHAGLQNLDADFVGAELGQRALDRFHRTLHVGLQHQRQQLLFAGLAGLEKLVERLARIAGLARFAALAAAIFGDFAGAGFGFHHHHFVARFRRRRKTQHFHRRGRPGEFHGLAAIVLQQANPAPFRTGNHDVADLQGAALHQHGGDGAAALVELGLDHRAFGAAFRIGLEVEDFGLQQDRLFQLVEIGALGGRDFDHLGFAAHVFDLDFVLQKLGLDPVGIGVALVDLVDRHDHGHACRLGMGDGFHGLRHHAVIGGHDQDHQIGDLGAARAHLR